MLANPAEHLGEQGSRSWRPTVYQTSQSHVHQDPVSKKQKWFRLKPGVVVVHAHSPSIPETEAEPRQV